MSGPFAYICTKTSADFIVPATSTSQAEFMRKVKNAFAGLVGGVTRAGTITFQAVETPLANHVPCDGAVYNKLQFPDLFRAIGTTFGGDGVTTFAVPNYSGALTVDTPTETTVVTDGGTVSTGGTVDTSNPAGGSVGGNVPSGGRPVRIAETLPPNPEQ